MHTKLVYKYYLIKIQLIKSAGEKLILRVKTRGMYDIVGQVYM